MNCDHITFFSKRKEKKMRKVMFIGKKNQLKSYKNRLQLPGAAGWGVVS
jgi:hypothetical protein